MNAGEPTLETKNKPTIETSKPSLPDDLLLICFALVSRLYYPTLSLVSKRFRSLLASPELYEVRSLLNRTESCLYVCLESPRPGFIARWFTLCRKPNQTLTNHTSEKNKKSSGYVLVPISVSHAPPTYRSCLVAVGSNIYNIGGPRDKEPSSSVSILDCRSHRWHHDAPKMQVERNYASASVLDEKIYVSGGYDDSIEVFDSKTQVWAPVPSPNWRKNWRDISKTICIDGNLYLQMFGGQGGMVYNREEDKWDLINEDMGLNVLWSSYCVIDNVLYCYYQEFLKEWYGKLKWYDIEVRKWKILMGLEGLPKFPCSARVELADYGGKMVVLWNQYIPSTASKENSNTIWCAEIALKIHTDCEIWGEVEWFGDVLEVANLYSLEKVLVPTL